jgi:hypothetical protein
MLVASECVNKRIVKGEVSICCPGSGGSFNGFTARWCDRVVASGHVLPLVLIFRSLNEKVMPKFPDDDYPLFVLKIPGLPRGRQLIYGRLDLRYVLLLLINGASMEGFNRRNQDDTLYKIHITL